MNIIDIFTNLGKTPKMEKFILSFKKNEVFLGSQDTKLTVDVNNKVIWSVAGAFSGIIYYLDIDNAQYMSDSEKERRKKDGYFFNNFWPKHGESGDIDCRRTIRMNFEKLNGI